MRRWLDRPATKSALLVLAGGLSGAVAKSATAPLERAKIMSQAGDTGNFVKILRDVTRVEGWQGLWRGNSGGSGRTVYNMARRQTSKSGTAARPRQARRPRSSRRSPPWSSRRTCRFQSGQGAF